MVAALAVPLAYEVFRAGYFGTLVPLPALAKNATDAHWHRGFTYLLDTVRPCWLWLPGCVLVAVFALGIKRLTSRERIVVAAPAIIGFLLAGYVVRVGGDFMHARMLLLPAFALLLPAFVLPLGRVMFPAVVVLVGWTITIAWRVGDGKSHVTITHGIEDERVGYVHWIRRKHPIKPEPSSPRISHRRPPPPPCAMGSAGSSGNTAACP